MSYDFTSQKDDQPCLFPWPVKGTKLGQDGKEHPFDFIALFEKMSTDDWARWQQETRQIVKNVTEANGFTTPAEQLPGSRDVALVRKVMLGWKMFSGDGKEIEFNEGNLERLLKDHPVPQIAAQAYTEMMGKGQSKALPNTRRG
jgi:hypothetical protein